MDRKLADFGDRLKTYEVGFFFFAGHGMQIRGENYLTAIDTDFDRELDAKHSSLPLNKVIETMEAAGNRTSILVLDACRTNPYERRWRGNASLGLAPIYAPKGMLVAFATSPGQVALDGAEENGSYTEALLAHLDQPDMSIEAVFKRVRNTLSSSTNGKQISWEHTSLMGDYCFNHSSAQIKGVTGYSPTALADRDFGPLRGAVGAIISGLKSHTWPQQNPAIEKITPVALSGATKNDCFVLGRNIYQAACGSSNASSSFVNDLRNSLAALPKGLGFHVLNGMLFEIYFNSEGLKRKRAKATYLDEVFALEEDEDHAESFAFIQQRLLPYRDELFYMPGSTTTIAVDAVIGRYEKKPAIETVCFEGERVLYNSAGDGYFELNENESLEKDTKESFRVKLTEAMIVPKFRLQIKFVGKPLNQEQFLAPWRPNLRRIAPK